MNLDNQICLRSAAIAALFLLCSSGLCGQDPANNMPVVTGGAERDSLAAMVLRMERLERESREQEAFIGQLNNRINGREETVGQLNEKIILQEDMIAELESKIRRQEEIIDRMDHELLRQEELIGLQDENSRVFRERSRRQLWWSVALVLVLLSVSSALFLLYLIRTRQYLLQRIRGVRDGTDLALDELRRKQKKLRVNLFAKVKADNRVLRSRIKAERKALRRTARKEIRTARKEIRTARKEIRTARK